MVQILTPAAHRVGKAGTRFRENSIVLDRSLGNAPDDRKESCMRTDQFSEAGANRISASAQTKQIVPSCV
jgi:hypothetical protein